MKKTLFILAIFYFLSLNLLSQTIYTPINDKIYNYLDRLALKKIISINDEFKPFTRITIARLLNEVKIKSEKLNKIEKEELCWFSEEYLYELGDTLNTRWRLINIEDSNYQIKVSPLLGYGISTYGDNSGHTRWSGLRIFGSYDKWFSAHFEYIDIGEFGDNVDKKRNNTSLTGHNYKTAPNGIEFSDVKGSIGFNWSWGSVSLIKDYSKWGHGRFGQVFISDKPASYPQIRFVIKPNDWIRFYYMHGWLNSLIPDSNAFYYNHTESEYPFLRRHYVPKHIVANMLTVEPISWLSLSIGNSYVYSGDLRPEMFIPFMYYKVMDHNTGREGWDDGNGQLFFDVKCNYLKNTSVYSSLLIDVLEIRDILKNTWWTSWFGYTVGAKHVDLFTPNLDITLEYTKTNPWVYENNDESSSYKHLNYSLGHWIGQNADHLRLQFDYKFYKKLDLSLFFERVRNGGLKDVIKYAYEDLENLDFLYSPLRKETSIGFSATYEFLHELFAKLDYKYTDITDEDIKRTPDYLLGKNHAFSFVVYYGM
ncbi:MAG: capsule assembly Wzi family protein [bacterium]